MGKQFSKDYQPTKRGRSFKSKLMEAIKKECLNDCDDSTSDKTAEEKFLSHVAKRAFNPDDPASGTLIKELLAKSYASIKPTLEKVEFEFDATKPAHEQSAQILQAAANGDIPPDVATIFIQAVKSNIDIEESTELKERIEKLEKLLDERAGQEA